MTDKTDAPISPEEIADLQQQEQERLDALEDLQPEPVEVKALGDEGPDYGDEFDEDVDDEEMEELIPVHEAVVLENGHIEISINFTLTQAHTLQDSLDLAAATLGRYGMDPFYMLAVEPSTGRRWVIHGGSIFREPDADDRG